MSIITFENIGGRLTIPKDPDSKLYYYGDISEWLADAGSAIASVEQVVVGVATIGEATFDGGVVRSFVQGLNEEEEAVNSLTWRVTLEDDQREDFSIYFTKREN